MTVPGARAGAHVAPAHAHVRADLRLPLRAPARRHLPRPRLRVRRAREAWTSRRCVRRVGRLPLLFEPGTRVQLQRLHRRARAGGRGPLRADAGRVLRGAHPRPARHDRHRVPARATPTGSPRSTQPRAGAQRPARARPRSRAPAFLSGGGGLVSTAADYHRFTQMLLGGASSTACACSAPRTLRYMGRNHLPGGAELKAVARPTIYARPRTRAWASGSASRVVLDPAAHEGRRLAGRARLGRAGQHGVLGRPEGAHHGAVLHAAGAVEHLPAALAAAPARLPGAGGLMRAKLVGVPGSHPSSAPS